MDSSLVSRGLALLRTWKSKEEVISIVFSSAINDFGMRGKGRILCLEQDSLDIEGDGFRVAVDLTPEAFVRIDTGTEVLKEGLDPAKYPETIELRLGNMERLIIGASPPPEEGKPN